MFWRVILFCWLATQIALANPTRSGTLTWSGSLPAPAVEVAVTVNGATAQNNGDFTFACSGLTLSNGANTFTVIAVNALGLHPTNIFTRNLPVSVNVYTDAAGNVTALLDGNENVAARYRYDPFGRLLGQWGSLANANRMQFSSMPHYGNSGLSLYPFRAYDPVLQRWLSRDPIGEAGGIDLYAFAGNSPLNAVDSDGRVLHILAGAAAGALIGGGFSIASDLFHGRDVDWVQAGISATEGAIAGAVASATFGTSLAGSGLALAARGAAAGLAGDLAAQGAGLAAQTRQCFSFKEAGLSTLLGAGGPLAGKLLGKFFERFAKVEIPVAAKSELGILGKGSTADLAKGTTLPRNLREQLAIEQAAASPAAGTKLPINMTDPRWPGAQGWEKWQQVIKPGGDPINVHYLRNPVTGQIDDFKIVVPGAR